MRIIGFSVMWDKLNKPDYKRDVHPFTTFRYPRRDRDWEVEEVVQVVYKPRSKDRKPLGIARIIRKEEKNIKKEWSYYPLPNFPNTPDMITPSEAEEDGFDGQHGGGDVRAMISFIRDYSRGDVLSKLTLYWIERINHESLHYPGTSGQNL